MTTPSNPANGLQLYRRLLGYVLPYKAMFAIALLGMLVVAASDAGFAAVLKPIMDRGFVEQEQNFIQWVPLLLFLLALLRALGTFCDNYCTIWVARRVIQNLRQRMFEQMIYAPVSYFDRHSTNRMVSRLTHDVEQVAQASSSVFRVLFRDVCKTIFLLTWMFYLSWKLSLVFMLILPLAFFIFKLSSRRFRAISLRIQDSVGEIAHVAKEAFQGNRVMKIFGAHDYQGKEFYRANNRNRQQLMKLNTVLAISAPLIALVSGGGIAGVVWLALYQEISPGVFSSYLLSMSMLMRPIKNLSGVNQAIQVGMAGAESIFRTIDLPSEPDRGSRILPHIVGNVSFKDICFQYKADGKRVLDHVSFDIAVGSTVALVGVSGSGKSTLVSLLLRFYECSQGVIKIDGQPLNDIKLSSLRQNMAMVTQEITLFDQSIRNNITYGAPAPVDQHKLLAAVEAAHVGEFVDRLPEGLDTLVGEQGIRLSGGQRQRIAIARALYKDAPLLILDEATSSLDSHSERHIQQAIEKLIDNRTTLIIAHRLSTIKRADLILMLDAGRIVERGTHPELMRLGGAYSRLYHQSDQGEPDRLPR